jgi:hypothetical protein
LLLCLLAVLAESETFVDIACFGDKKARSSSPVSAAGWA